MGLREDFQSYFDGNGLIAPNPVPQGTLKGSDNGPMYTSEYYIMLKKSGLLTDKDIQDFQSKIGQCIDIEDLLNRVPVDQLDGLEGPDDYYGVLDGCKQLGNTKIPRQFLWAVIKNKGALNNVSPGVWSWQSFLIRQPQLLTSMIAAAFPSFINPLHLLIRFLSLPLFLIAAVAIAVSCWGSPTSDTDSRRLSWHLWQCVGKVSLLCWLASKVWLWRLYSDYGSNGMKAVASIYYHPQPTNPFSTYWITK
jgi:hypothetical protein